MRRKRERNGAKERREVLKGAKDIGNKGREERRRGSGDRRAHEDQSCISTSDPETFHSRTELTQRLREQKQQERRVKERESASSLRSAYRFAHNTVFTEINTNTNY